MQRISEFKKYFLYTMIGCLIAGSLVAVTSVMIGSFNETSSRIVGTLVIIVAHALVSFFILPDNKDDNFLNRFKMFSDILFFLLIASLFTAILATWQAFSTDVTGQLYGIIGTIGVSALQINAYRLLQIKNKALSMATNVGSALAVLFGSLLTVLILGYSSWLEGSLEIFNRLLASVGILDSATLVIAAVLYKLYLQKHPNEKNILKFGGNTSVLRIIGIAVLALIALNVLVSLLFFLMSSVNNSF